MTIFKLNAIVAGGVVAATGGFIAGVLAPGLRALASVEKDRLKVAKLDVDANPATTERYGVESYPTCILFRGGEPIERLDGYMPLRKIEAALQKHLDAL